MGHRLHSAHPAPSSGRSPAHGRRALGELPLAEGGPTNRRQSFSLAIDAASGGAGGPQRLGGLPSSRAWAARGRSTSATAFGTSGPANPSRAAVFGYPNGGLA
jgi:hypothetical protein